ncbi:hypothetical protein LX32DRAFT_688491 [Colletotrichum zoysiae]|uniref:Uncharacterized protein n=1 Tax=Colletotrichum zoysiae TaxID=1216348 RepID=A0AAD9HW61_9PEZI|nr:hypothetical protein LX32DRAFT_688491 [Colletotrichum zoysiae]
MAVPVVPSFRIPGLRRRPDLEDNANSRAKALHEWATGLEDATRIASQQAAVEEAEAEADTEAQTNHSKATGSIRPPRNQPHHLQTQRHLSRSGYLKKLQLHNVPTTTLFGIQQPFQGMGTAKANDGRSLPFF